MVRAFSKCLTLPISECYTVGLTDRSTRLSKDPNTLRAWMRAATTAQLDELAKRAKTSRNYLHQLAGGHRTAGAEIAGRIEEASRLMRVESRFTLPWIDRASLCPACAGCPYAGKCRRKG